MAINLSPSQVQMPSLAQRLQEALTTHAIHPSRIKLEVTETSAIQDYETTTKVLHDLGDLGFGIDRDDFGTGLPSLAYQQPLPIDVINIDRSFMEDLEHNGANCGLVRAIVGMATILGKTVIAEGIEREDQCNDCPASIVGTDKATTSTSL